MVLVAAVVIILLVKKLTPMFLSKLFSTSSSASGGNMAYDKPQEQNQQANYLATSILSPGANERVTSGACSVDEYEDRSTEVDGIRFRVCHKRR